MIYPYLVAVGSDVAPLPVLIHSRGVSLEVDGASDLAKIVAHSRQLKIKMLAVVPPSHKYFCSHFFSDVVRHCTDMPEGHTAEMSGLKHGFGIVRFKLGNFHDQLISGIDLANALA